MSLGFNLEPRLVQLCETCGEPMNEHARGCPTGALRALFEARRSWTCPGCHRRRALEVNDSDFFECRRCGAVWVAGLGAGEPTVACSRTSIIDLDTHEVISVYRAAEPGRGEFPIDRTARRLRGMEAEMRRKRKEGG